MDVRGEEDGDGGSQAEAMYAYLPAEYGGPQTNYLALDPHQGLNSVVQEGLTELAQLETVASDAEDFASAARHQAFAEQLSRSNTQLEELITQETDRRRCKDWSGAAKAREHTDAATKKVSELLEMIEGRKPLEVPPMGVPVTDVQEEPTVTNYSNCGEEQARTCGEEQARLSSRPSWPPHRAGGRCSLGGCSPQTGL